MDPALDSGAIMGTIEEREIAMAESAQPELWEWAEYF
jgi:hypothetical protein